MMLGDPDRGNAAVSTGPSGSALAEFEQAYRHNVDVVTAYFARRCAEPQVVADLTSETFVRAAGAFGSFDPGRGTARAWLFGIAGHVFAGHCAQTASGRAAVARLAQRRPLDTDEMEELAAKIDAERAGRELIARCAPQHLKSAPAPPSTAGRSGERSVRRRQRSTCCPPATPATPARSRPPARPIPRRRPRPPRIGW